MKTKKFTATIEYNLGERIKELAQEKGMTLRQMQERMITNTLEAHRIAKEIRG